VYVPIQNALGALGKDDARRNTRTAPRIQALGEPLKQVADTRGHEPHLGGD